MIRPSAVAGLVLTALGLGDSFYLAYEHATANTTLACNGHGAIDCVKVTTSTYSKIAGIPVAYVGVAFFVAMLVVALVAAFTPRRVSRIAENVQLVGFATGLAMVAYLVWAEIQLGAICLWCTGVHLVTFALFALSVFVVVLRDPADA